MTIVLVCMNCGVDDARSNRGDIFCHNCRDGLSSVEKDLAIDAYLHRMVLLREAFQTWDQAA